MALSRTIVEQWLVGQCRAHMAQAKLSTIDDGTNMDLNGPLWDGLRRQGIVPVDLTAIDDEDFATIGPDSYSRFLIGCMIALKRRILNFYRSQATQEGSQARLEFQKRADGLAADIEADELMYERESDVSFISGAVGAELIPGTNIPDAPFLRYVG